MSDAAKESKDSKAMPHTKKVTAEIDQVKAVVKASGIDESAFDMSGAESIQTGGITKWIDLAEFQVNPEAGQQEAVKGNGKAFAGALLSRQEIENGIDKVTGEVKIRYFYLLRLVAPCPVTYKDDNKDEVHEIAPEGEIVAIGERHSLKPLADLCTDGGLYILAIKPHSRVKISGGHTMWTFDVVKKTLRAPVKMQTVSAEKAPF